MLKEDLLAAGWQGRVVSENSLNKSVSRIRHLLGDADGELLCTSHGYGYRLLLSELVERPSIPVMDTNADITHAQAPAGRNATTGNVPRRIAWAVIASAVLAALIAIALNLPGALHPDAGTARLAAATMASPVQPAGNPDGVVLPSIAVLPFADLSEAHDQGYFSDGLAEEILDRLAKLPQLHVASRTSAFVFRGAPSSVADIGQKLGVSSVLEGSVRKSGDRVRITVQLIQVSDGFHLWSETYDRTLTEVFAVQDDISRSVVDALQLHLPPGQLIAMNRHSTSSAAAFNQFLLGRQFRQEGNPDDDRRAIAAYQRAITLDPNFSTALAELGMVLGGDALWADTPGQVAAGKVRSLELLSRAIALEPANTSYLTTRADLLSSTMHDWAGAQRDLDNASRLLGAPDVRLLVQQSRVQAMLGNVGQAIAIDRRAVALNPSSVTPMGMLGFHLAIAGKHDEAREILLRALHLSPDDDHNTYYLGVAELLDGKPEAAIAAFEQSGHGFRLAGLAAAQHDSGNALKSQEALDALVARYADADAYQVAQAHAWRGETDQAFAWLDRAQRQRDAGLVHMKFDPLMRPLRRDPRYRAWLRRLNLSDTAGLVSRPDAMQVPARTP